jgi:mRNA interferase RelE/StbE
VIALEIKLTRDAARQIEKLNQPLKSRILEAISNLPSGDVKKLKGSTTKSRLRVGDYRVIVDMCGNTLVVGEILPRGEAYKRI